MEKTSTFIICVCLTFTSKVSYQQKSCIYFLPSHISKTSDKKKTTGTIALTWDYFGGNDANITCNVAVGNHRTFTVSNTFDVIGKARLLPLFEQYTVQCTHCTQYSVYITHYTVYIVQSRMYSRGS